MRCPSCGLFNTPDARRCDCGYDLTGLPVEVEPERRPPLFRKVLTNWWRVMTTPDAFFASMRTDTLREAMGFFVFWIAVSSLATLSWWLHFRVAYPEIGRSLGGGIFGAVVIVAVAPFWMLFYGWLLSGVASLVTRLRQPVTPARCIVGFAMAPLVINGLLPWGLLVAWPWAWRAPAMLYSYYIATRGLRMIQKLSPLQSWLVVAVTGVIMFAIPPPTTPPRWTTTLPDLNGLAQTLLGLLRHGAMLTADGPLGP